ncbi:hypothetical protein LXL04_004854 [Taraxacum kok-saghyz]
MEVPEIEEGEKGSHLISPAAFVEGGIQEACEDSCSICLEAFCDSDPGTVTSCKHEFHLQCILEWCQRSSNCPMCWQAISLKDPSSQELLEGVEQERRVRFINPTRNPTIFHHPTLGDFELQHLPVGVNDSELEERIIQHLAAAAAMGRARHLGRREGSRTRSTPHGRPQFLVFSTSPNAGPVATVAGSGGPVVQLEKLEGKVGPQLLLNKDLQLFIETRAVYLPCPINSQRGHQSCKHLQTHGNLNSMLFQQDIKNRCQKAQEGGRRDFSTRIHPYQISVQKEEMKLMKE